MIEVPIHCGPRTISRDFYSDIERVRVSDCLGYTFLRLSVFTDISCTAEPVENHLPPLSISKAERAKVQSQYSPAMM